MHFGSLCSELCLSHCSSQTNDSSKKPLKQSFFKIEVRDTHMYRFVLICGCWIANNENSFEVDKVDKQWTNLREPYGNQNKESLLSLRRSWTKNWRVGSQFIPLCFSAHLLVFSATADHIFLTWSSITQMWLPSSSLQQLSCFGLSSWWTLTTFCIFQF